MTKEVLRMNNEKKIVLQKRTKSWLMWIGYIAAAALAVGIDWHDLQSWQLVWDKIIAFLSSPASIIEFFAVLIATSNNPTNKSGF